MLNRSVALLGDLPPYFIGHVARCDLPEVRDLAGGGFPPDKEAAMAEAFRDVAWSAPDWLAQVDHGRAANAAFN
jgi:hypothetical protein